MSARHRDPSDGTLGPMPVPLTISIIAAVTVALVWWWLVPRIPEPDAEELAASTTDGEPPKRLYRTLATPTSTLLVVTAAAITTAAVVWVTPPGTWPLWVTLTTAGLVLAAIDARTTWIPLQTTHIGWTAMGVAVLVSWWVGGWHVAAAALLGAALSMAVWWLVWFLSRGGFGFGDVRMAPLVGAPTMATSSTCFMWALLVGSLITLAWAVLDRTFTRRPRMIPWAPGYLAGAVVAGALA